MFNWQLINVYTTAPIILLYLLPLPSPPNLTSDPIPVLEQAVAVQQRLQSAQDHEVQNTKLRETLEEYKTEFAQVKSQGELPLLPSAPLS